MECRLNVYFQFSNNLKKISLELCLCVQVLCHGSLNYCPFFFLMVFLNFFPTFQEPECCAGFYGPSCHPCPGPFDNACNGNLNGKVQYER